MDLTTRVAQAIDTNPQLSQRRLRFENKHGRVTLRGTVSSFFQKQIAQEAIKRVEGVEYIANDLEVVWG